MNKKQIQELPRNIKLGNKKIAIYGIGFVGTAIASTWLRAGASIIAVDKKNTLVNNINNKKITNSEPKAREAFIEGINSKRLTATTNGKWASKYSDIKIISVPVGLDKRSADLRFLYSAVEDIITGLKKNDIIIITPTVPIGTSNKIIKWIENKSKLKVEKDFFLIYTPERISAGQAISDIENNYPPILSGAGEISIKIANKMFEVISSKKPITMSTTEAAEAEKRRVELAKALDAVESERDEVDGELMDYYTTFLASIFRSVRFGASSAHGKANMIRFNYFKEQGAFTRNPETGKYKVDFEKMAVAMNSLSEKILTLQVGQN